MLQSIFLDAHFDVLLDVLHFRALGERKVLERKHLPILRAAGINALICSIFISDTFLPEGALRNALDQISALNEEIDESHDYFALCRDTNEAQCAFEDGKIAIFLSLEGAEPIGNDILLLRVFYELGVRLLGMTWSRRNYAADGSSFKAEDAPGTAGGLTKFGRDILMKAQKLGMLIDVSHINDPGFYDVSVLSKGPFIASHSNCRALCGVARNLTDDQISSVAKAGGVIGINAYSPFCTESPDSSSPEKLLKHVSHIIDIAGPEHVGLGLDLCDCVKSLQIEVGPSKEKDIFVDHTDVYERFIKPIRNNYSTEIAEAIIGRNFFRVLKKVLG